jgi:hypothetical protein
VTISGAPSGSGDGVARYLVSENFATSSRIATITIASQTHRVTQEEAEEIDLKGRVTGLSGSCPNLRFSIGSQLVRTSGTTEFKEGKCTDVRNGEEVKVRGLRQADGTLLARRLELED